MERSAPFKAAAHGPHSRAQVLSNCCSVYHEAVGQTSSESDCPRESNEYAEGALVQLDGKIVLAGSTDADGPGKIALVRYTASGQLDSTFGTGLEAGLTPAARPAAASPSETAADMDRSFAELSTRDLASDLLMDDLAPLWV